MDWQLILSVGRPSWSNWRRLPQPVGRKPTHSTRIKNLSLRTADDIIGIPRTALGTAQPSRPDQYRCFSAVLFSHFYRVGLKAMLASLAPHNQANMRRRGLAKCQ
jgi:hypothetical protein